MHWITIPLSKYLFKLRVWQSSLTVIRHQSGNAQMSKKSGSALGELRVLISVTIGCVFVVNSQIHLLLSTWKPNAVSSGRSFKNPVIIQRGEQLQVRKWPRKSWWRHGFWSEGGCSKQHEWWGFISPDFKINTCFLFLKNICRIKEKPEEKKISHKHWKS